MNSDNETYTHYSQPGIHAHIYELVPFIDETMRNENMKQSDTLLTDHFDSTEALADSTGKDTSSISHDSFGNATSSIATHYRYTGHFKLHQKMEQWQRKPYLFVRTVNDQPDLDS